MHAGGAKLFTCRYRSSCNKKSCAMCGKRDKCVNCEYDGSRIYSDRDKSRFVPKCYRTLN